MPAEAAARDPRDIVTPDAFTVAGELLGLPLARPFKRLAAITLDAIAIGLLSLSGAISFALAIGLLTYQLVRGRRNAETRRAPRTALLVALLLGSMTLWLGLEINEADTPYTSETSLAELSDTVEEMSENPELAALQAAVVALEADNKRLREADPASRLLTAGEGLLDRIGIGFGWAAVYFTLFGLWWEGQTLGKRLLGLRVVRLNGKPLTAWNSFDRYGGYAAGFATGLLGFAQVFWDPNRQAIHDRICATVVIDARRAHAHGAVPL